ncbi:MAG: hypothetical protein SO112_01395 [Treponema sp.]|nr:hypothetical protein [Treponema sp.]
MDRIEYKKKLTIQIFFVFISIMSCASDSKIPQKIPRIESELDNIFVEKLFDGQKDSASLEDYNYLCETSKRISDYLSDFECIKLEDYKELIGSWMLVDQTLTRVANNKKFFMSNMVQIVNIFENKLSFQNQSSTSLIYKDDNDNLVFKSKWIEALRQIRIINNRMYIYILNGDYWELDRIHEDGKYFFIMENKSNSEVHKNMFETFEKF